MERVEGKLELTKLNINCCDELLIDNNVISATYELWFDVAEYFSDIEEIKNISDAEWVNFYTNYNPYDEKLTACVVIAGIEADTTYAWNLTEAEEAFLISMVEDYCQDLYGVSCKELLESEND